MDYRGLLRAFGALAVLTACSGTDSTQANEFQPKTDLAAPIAAGAAPSATWSGVERIALRCILTSTTTDYPAAQQALCARLEALASEGAPVPIKVIGPGDNAMIEPGTLTLVVHGAILPTATVIPGQPGRFLAFTARPLRVAADEQPLVGTAPRAVPLENDRLAGVKLDGALGAMLDEVLNWRRQNPALPERL
jgi:hypothetical protein